MCCCNSVGKGMSTVVSVALYCYEELYYAGFINYYAILNASNCPDNTVTYKVRDTVPGDKYNLATVRTLSRTTSPLSLSHLPSPTNVTE